MTKRGRVVLGVVAALLAGALGLGVFALLHPAGIGDVVDSVQASTSPPLPAATAPTVSAVPSDPVRVARPFVGWAVGFPTTDVVVDRGAGPEVVFVNEGAATIPVGWFGEGLPNRLVVLVGQDLFELLVIDLETGQSQPLDDRLAVDAWTDESGQLNAVLVTADGERVLQTWDFSGVTTGTPELVGDVPDHDTPGAARTPGQAWSPAPGFAVTWDVASTEANTSVLTVDGTVVAEGSIAAVVTWPAVAAGSDTA